MVVNSLGQKGREKGSKKSEKSIEKKRERKVTIDLEENYKDC